MPADGHQVELRCQRLPEAVHASFGDPSLGSRGPCNSRWTEQGLGERWGPLSNSLRPRSLGLGRCRPQLQLKPWPPAGFADAWWAAPLMDLLPLSQPQSPRVSSLVSLRALNVAQLHGRRNCPFLLETQLSTFRYDKLVVDRQRLGH